MIKTIIALGNPGDSYKKNRHNIGFRMADHVIEQHHFISKGVKFHADYFEGMIGESKVRILKPLTYMNESGKSALAVLSFYKEPTTSCLVLTDDFDIPFGQLRLKQKGSGGTHNGLKSIVQTIGSEFPRLRIGIGPKPERQDVASFVLSNFNSEEERHIHDHLLTLTLQAIEKAL